MQVGGQDRPDHGQEVVRIDGRVGEAHAPGGPDAPALRVERQRERRELSPSVQHDLAEQEGALGRVVALRFRESPCPGLDAEGVGPLGIQAIRGLDFEAQRSAPRYERDRAVRAIRLGADPTDAEHLLAGHVEEHLESDPLVVGEPAAAEIDEHAAYWGEVRLVARVGDHCAQDAVAEGPVADAADRVAPADQAEGGVLRGDLLRVALDLRLALEIAGSGRRGRQEEPDREDDRRDSPAAPRGSSHESEPPAGTLEPISRTRSVVRHSLRPDRCPKRGYRAGC